MRSRRHLRAVPPADGVRTEVARERSRQTSGLAIHVTIGRATGAGAGERRERQLRAIVRLLRRAGALNGETKRAA
jgi:hypothetical protein